MTPDEMCKKGSVDRAVSVAILLAALALGCLLLLFLALNPLSGLINQYLAKSAFDIPWMQGLTSITAALFLLFSYLAVDSWARREPYATWKRILLAVISLLLVLVLAGLLGKLALFLAGIRETTFLAARLRDFVPGLAAGGLVALGAVMVPAFTAWKRPRTCWAVFALVVAALVYGVLHTPSVHIVAGPWLQLAEEGALTVGWLTDVPSTGWVEYGDGLTLRAQSSHNGLVDAGTRIHHVTLTGLKPGAQTPYRVATRSVGIIAPAGADLGAVVYSDQHVFKAPDPAGESASFAMFCDLHDAMEVWPDVIEKADVRHRDFVIFNGDAMTHVDDERQIIDHFLRPASRLFAAEVPFVYVRGNHEARGNFARLLKNYTGISEQRPYMGMFRAGPLAFLVMDTGEDNPDSDPEFAGLVDFTAWRAEEERLIAPLTSGSGWATAPFRLLFAHIPLNDDHPWVPALSTAGITAQLAGHIHGSHLREPNGRRPFPVIIGSGNTRKTPLEYNYTVGAATKEKLTLEVVCRDGKIVDQYEFP